MEGERQTKKCPHCAEEILLEANKCKHCGEWLEKKESSADIPPDVLAAQKRVLNYKDDKDTVPKEVRADVVKVLMNNMNGWEKEILPGMLEKQRRVQAGAPSEATNEKESKKEKAGTTKTDYLWLWLISSVFVGALVLGGLNHWGWGFIVMGAVGVLYFKYGFKGKKGVSK